MLFGGMGHFWDEPVLPQRLGQPLVTNCPVRPRDPGLGTEFGELDACPLASGWSAGTARSTASFMISKLLKAVREYQWRIHPVIDQSNVEMSRRDQPDRLVRLPLGHPKPQLLMFLPKPGNCLGKDGSRCSGETGNLQITDDVVALPVKLTLCVLDLGQDRVRSPRQQGACRRESYAAAVRLDESLPHVALQLGQLLGYGRGCQV